MQKRRARKEGAGPAARPEGEDVRLNRFIAMSGLCSRRKADELIEAGEVKVNDEVITDFSYRVRKKDEVVVRGKSLRPQNYVYILLNKPSDTITTTQDEKGRRTVLDLVDLPEVKDGNVFPVGRLDRDTVGVLLLTNDGDLANRLMHPRYEVDKYYHVRTRQPVKPHELDQLRTGVQLDDGEAKADDIAYLAPPDRNNLGMKLHEGRNRQIRRMLEALGHEVDFLERVNYAGLTTRGVRRGKWRALRPAEINRLRNLVKLK